MQMKCQNFLMEEYLLGIVVLTLSFKFQTIEMFAEVFSFISFKNII